MCVLKATKYTVICSGSNKEGRQMLLGHTYLLGVDIWIFLVALGYQKKKLLRPKAALGSNRLPSLLWDLTGFFMAY